MRLLRCEVSIGDYTFDFVTDIEIVSSWDLLTDTATITIPKRLRYRGEDGKIRKYIVRGTEAVFKRGDEVKIDCGYYPSPEFGEHTVYYTAFQGFVTDVSPKRPITIQCEDSAYNLKRMRIEKYSSGKTPQSLDFTLKALADLVNSNAGGVSFNYGIKAESMDLGETILENITYADFLDMLKRTYGLRSYIRDTILYVGFARTTQRLTVDNVFSVPNNTVQLAFGRDIINDSNLTYRNEADIDINLTCISVDDDNERIEATAGDPWGSARNLYYYNMKQADLQKMADSMVEEFKFNGYRGSFTVFGVPQVQHGDSVEIFNGDIQDTTGEYILEKVVTRFGQGGFRQEVFLSARIDR
jgi:hypothetical protein